MAGVRIAVVINIGDHRDRHVHRGRRPGAFISRGISQTDSRQLVTGALAVSLLAIVRRLPPARVADEAHAEGLRTSREPRPAPERTLEVRGAA